MLDPHTSADLWSVHYRPDGVVWIGGFDTLYHGVNGGNTLVKSPTYFQDAGQASIFGLYLALHAQGPTSGLITGVVALGDAEVVLRTQNISNGFELVHAAEVSLVDFLNDIHIEADGSGLAVGTNGRILRTDDNGLSWIPRPSGTESQLHAIARAAAGVYLVASSDGLIRSVDNGFSWVQQASHSAKWVTCADGTCYTVNADTVVRSTDAGATWSDITTLPFTPTAVEQLGANTLMVATAEGLFRSTSAGQFWEQFDLTGYRTVKQIDFHDAHSGIAVGEGGYVVRTANAGGAAAPLARFSDMPINICNSSTVHLSNLGDPNWSHRWLLNGEQVSLQFDLTLTLSTPGPAVLQLISTNTSGSDTSSVDFNVIPSPSVPVFEIVASADTVCPMVSPTLHLTGLTSGVWYTVYGNGSTLVEFLASTGSFNHQIGPLPSTTSISVVGRRSNACGVDSLERSLTIAVTSVEQVTYSVESDTLCHPEGVVVHLYDTPPGYRFRWSLSPSGQTGPWILAEADTLTFSLPTVTPAGTHQLSVRGRYRDQVCFQLVQNTTTIRSIHTNSSFSVDKGILIPGVPLEVDPNFTGFSQAEWIFAEGAEPASFTGLEPPPVLFNTTGAKAIRVTQWVGQGYCTAVDTILINVVAHALGEDMPSCSNGQALLAPTIMDLHLDGDNSSIIVGNYRYPTNNVTNFFVMKQDSSGTELWRYLVAPPQGITMNSKAFACTTDPVGNVYIAVEMEANAQFTMHGIPITQRYGIIKLDPMGTPQWIVGSSTAHFMGLAGGVNGLIYATGWGMPNTPTWGESVANLTQANGIWYDLASVDTTPGLLWVVALNENGMVIHADRFGRRHSTVDPTLEVDVVPGVSDVSTNSPFWNNPLIEVMDDGRILLAAALNSVDESTFYVFDDLTVRYDAGCALPQFGNKIFLARFSPNLELEDAAVVLSAYRARLRSLSVNAEGSIALSGRLNNNLCMDGVDHEYPGQESNFLAPFHGFIATFDSTFTGRWHSASRYSEVLDAAINNDGSVLGLVGSRTIGGVMDATGTTHGLLGAGNYDGALVHFSATGEVVGTEVSTDAANDVSCWVEKDACGAHHIVGIGGWPVPPNMYERVWGTGTIGMVLTRTIGEQACSPDCAVGNNPVTFVSQTFSPDAVHVYPTVNDGRFTIEWPREWPKNIGLNIYDATGRIVLQRSSVHRSEGASLHTDLRPGTYLVKLISIEGQSHTRHIVVAE